MFVKVVIYRNVAFTHSNTLKDITELKQNMQFTWECAFNKNGALYILNDVVSPRNILYDQTRGIEMKLTLVNGSATFKGGQGGEDHLDI